MFLERTEESKSEDCQQRGKSEKRNKVCSKIHCVYLMLCAKEKTIWITIHQEGFHIVLDIDPEYERRRGHDYPCQGH